METETTGSFLVTKVLLALSSVLVTSVSATEAPWWPTSNAQTATSIVPMPPAASEPDGVLHRRDDLEFRLDSELKRMLRRDDGLDLSKHAVHVYGRGRRSILVADARAPWGLITELQPPAELDSRVNALTRPRLRAASYLVASGATVDHTGQVDQQWKTYLESNIALLQLIPCELPVKPDTGPPPAEFLWRNNGIDVLVHYRFDRAVLEWETSDHRLQSYMHLFQRGEPIDREWVRSVARSLRLKDGSEASPRQKSKSSKSPRSVIAAEVPLLRQVPRMCSQSPAVSVSFVDSDSCRCD